MYEGLGEKFVGTSNCLIAKNRDLEAIGTNAHELPMVYAALAETDEDAGPAPYDVLGRLARGAFDGNLRIILPDTYGTKGFLRKRARLAGGLDRHPHRFRRPGEGAGDGDRLVESARRGPDEKLVIFSDGLDVDKIDRASRRVFGPLPGVLRLGHAADQRFPRAGGGRRARAVQPGVQGRLGQRAAHGEAQRQPGEGDGAGGREIARYKRVFGVGEQEAMEVVV
jgi:nicotinate phosphoribosyltransferase